MVLFFHFLVVASALLGLAGADEVGHAFEDFVGSAKVFEHEVAVVEFEEPVIEFVFLVSPMSLLYVFGFGFSRVVLEMRVFLLRFLLGLLPS